MGIRTCLCAAPFAEGRVIDWQAVESRLRSDGEFAVSSRMWTATLRLDVGSDSRTLRVEDGRVVSLDAAAPDADCDVFVTAPLEVWERMLERVPAPFYQDLFPASLHHGLVMNVEMLDYAAYYPALRRLLEVMREVRSCR